MSVEIRRLGEEDATSWWNLRLEGLEREPFAFGKAVEEHKATPVDVMAERFRHASAESFTLGAFDGDRLVGMATFRRDSGLKDRHKGHIYGVYVTAAHRGKGLGRALVTQLLEEAEKDSSLEQILLGTTQAAALAMYRALGFETFGVEPKALKVGSDYVDETHMIRFMR